MARKNVSVRPQPPRPRPVGRTVAARSAKVKKVVAPKSQKVKAPKKSQKASSIIDSNRKTEICRNWQRGTTCAFGARCAFAHGEGDLKLKTLRELEKEGRIPDASKHHSSMCMIWVSTGACPYGKGCVFIHDPRATGPAEATLRPPPNLEKISSTSSRTGLSRLLCAEEGGRTSPLSFPAIPRDLDSEERPADKVRYDLDLDEASNSGGRNLSVVFKVWYSFLSTIIELNVLTVSGTPNVAPTPTANTDTTSSSNASASSTPPCLEPPSPATTVRESYKDAATRSLAARHSPAKTAGTTASAKGAPARVATTHRASPTAVGSTAAAAAAVPNLSTTRATAAATPRATITASATGATTTLPAAASRLERVEGLLKMAIPRPRDSVRHLPVFKGLCEGNSLARPDALPLPDSPLAFVQGAASAGGDDGGGEDAAPSPAPSSCSVYYSPTSSPSPSEAAAPPCPVGGTTTAAAAGVVQVEGDSFFSCPSSPAWSTAMLKPPPGFEAAHSSTASVGWSSTSTDAASWTSSACSSEHDDAHDDQDHDDHIEYNGGFDFLERFDENVPDPWTSGTAAGEGRVPRTTARLPFFAGVRSDDSSTITITSNSNSNSNRSNDSSTRAATNGDGGMGGICYLPPGGGGGAIGYDYLMAFDSGSGSASGYRTGGGFFRLDDAAATTVAPFKAEYGYPVAQAPAEYHCQGPYPDAAKNDTCNIYATHVF